MLDQYMEKLSRDMELEGPLKAQIPNVYTIPLEEGFKVTIAETSADHLTLSSTIGTCPTMGKEAFFTQLLLANLLGQGTRGAVLGMDIEANEVTVTQNIDYHVEYKDFRDIVEDFVNIADFWRQETLASSALQ